MMDKLSPNNSPERVKVKRINRLPLLIVFILVFAVASAFGFLIIQSGKRNNNVAQSDQQKSLYRLDTSQAENLLHDKPKYGVIGEPPKEIRNKKVQAPPVVPVAQPSLTPRQEISAEQKEADRIQQAKIRRLESALSAPAKINSQIGNNYTNPAIPVSTNTASSGTALHPLSSLNTDHLFKDKDDDPNKQKSKADFVDQKQPMTEYLLHTVNQQQSPLEIKTGTIIPATMISGLNSDLPGMMLAQVSQNVYDTATGDLLLIPQGSRLVGKYDSFITYGQNRALVAWNRIIYPNGSTLELEGMPGTDQAGYAGLEDQVDNHYFKIFGSALLMSVITGIYDYSQDQGNYYENKSAGDSMAQAVARELTQTSQMLLRKNMDIQPTIKIRPGYKLNIMVNRDIIFPSVW